MTNFFDMVDVDILDKLGRMPLDRLPYSLITCEEDYDKLQAVIKVKWIAEHMGWHYAYARLVLRTTQKEFIPHERVRRAFEETSQLARPYMEKLNNKVLPSLEESHALRQAIAGPHSLVHRWCIDNT